MAEFSEMTVGYNFMGAQEYLSDLQATMIKDTKETIRGAEFDKVKSVLEECWVGQSEINFMAKFKKSTEQVCEFLDEMSDAINGMMNSIQEEMMERDKTIIDEII